MHAGAGTQLGSSHSPVCLQSCPSAVISGLHCPGGPIDVARVAEHLISTGNAGFSHCWRENEGVEQWLRVLCLCRSACSAAASGHAWPGGPCRERQRPRRQCSRRSRVGRGGAQLWCTRLRCDTTPSITKHNAEQQESAVCGAASAVHHVAGIWCPPRPCTLLVASQSPGRTASAYACFRPCMARELRLSLQQQLAASDSCSVWSGMVQCSLQGRTVQAAFWLTGRLMMAPVVPADGAPYRVEEPMESWERGSDFGGDGSVHSYPRRDYSQDTRHRAGQTCLAIIHVCVLVLS